MQNQHQSGVLQSIKKEFHGLGYVGDLLQEDYTFVDILSGGYETKRIPLAAFAQEPLSYRSASFGVAIANGAAGLDFIQSYRSLGAPQILELHNDHISRWKILGKDVPVLLEEVGIDSLHDFFARNEAYWSPRQVLAAKSGDLEGTQLDFFDLDLMPLLDYEVRAKLDTLLHDTISLAIDTFQTQMTFTRDHYPLLFRLIFRLIASKILADRGHPGDWDSDEPQSIIRAVEEFYFKDSDPEPVLSHPATQQTVWERIKRTFHFQNLSVDSLAYVYENTLVTTETRQLFGIHSTPPEIAEYMVRKLPFNTLPPKERRVFEPFSGHSVFLVAAMRRMRELLPPEMDSQERHLYFVDMLSGIEIDDFAREVARLSLMLADYPNPDGWKLYSGDALNSPQFQRELAEANVVLCNPPFEAFTTHEKANYSDLVSPWKPAEILYRILQNPPRLLGFVLPRAFLQSAGYRGLRKRLGETYSTIETLSLPDRVFQHSDAESVLLTAFGTSTGVTRFKAGGIYEWDSTQLYALNPSYHTVEELSDAGETLAQGMWRPALPEVWQATQGLQRLREFSSIHRGIEYNLPFHSNASKLVQSEHYSQFARGLLRVRDAVEPYMVLRTVYLNISPHVMRTNAYTLPWHTPKLIVNASQQSRGAWKITASPDDSGLVCYQNFHALWPTTTMPLEVMAAILNGPLANAFVGTREAKRHIRVQTLRDIPIPRLDQGQQETIASLVRQYSDARKSWLAGEIGADQGEAQCSLLLRSIDAEVLRAYDLLPRTERLLLDYFGGHSRLGPIAFTEYFPVTFEPYIPWHLYNSGILDKSNARQTLRRLPVIPKSQSIDDFLSLIE